MWSLARALCIMTFAGLTSPATGGAYLGAGIGAADYNESLWSISNFRDTGWKIFGGYQFNPYLTAEASWVDLGTVSDNSASIRTRGLSLAGIGSLPLGSSFALFGKLGAFFWGQDTRFGKIRDSNTGTDLSWGYGGSARFFDNRLGIRLEWERYGTNYDADLVTLGASYYFQP
jgi:OOP family OmpA-OmpF porin